MLCALYNVTIKYRGHGPVTESQLQHTANIMLWNKPSRLQYPSHCVAVVIQTGRWIMQTTLNMFLLIDP